MLSVVAKRRDAAIKRILRFKEEEADTYLPLDVRVLLRKEVLDEVNGLAEVAMDLIRSLDSSDVVINELWLTKLEEIHDYVKANGHSA